MRGAIKAAAYIGAGLGVGIFAYAFGLEHGRVVHEVTGASHARMMAYFGGSLAAAVALGLLCAFDVARFFGRKAERSILQGGWSPEPMPEFEEAERLRAGGEPLEAVRLLRECLQRHPGELDLMSRIAEIYRHDLNNPLAAALEYEDLLKHKPAPEQWGWAALHLAKLYGRLGQPDKAFELLERLENDYGQTVAARRASQVLGELRKTAPVKDEPEEG